MQISRYRKWLDSAVNKTRSESRDAQLSASQAQMFFGKLPIGITAAFLVAITLVVLLWQYASHIELLYWAGALVIVSIFRMGIYVSYRLSSEKDKNYASWIRRGVFGNFLGGLVWGCSIFLFNSRIDIFVFECCCHFEGVGDCNAITAAMTNNTNTINPQ